MKVLLIGANGQLGKTLRESVPKEIELVALDLPDIDITDLQQVESTIAETRPDIIVNSAAYTAVDRAEEEPEVAIAVNAIGPKNLAMAAKHCGARLIHVSTDYVFDGTAGTPYTPHTGCNPLGIYGKSKRQGELNILDAMDNFVIIRTSWLYSKYGNNFVLTMLRLMREREQLNIVADQIGGPTWTFSLAQAIWKLSLKNNLSGIFHFSNAGVASWYDFAIAIQEEAVLLGRLKKWIPIDPIRTERYPTPAKRPLYTVLDCTRTWHDFDISPIHWRVALRLMLKEL